MGLYKRSCDKSTKNKPIRWICSKQCVNKNVNNIIEYTVLLRTIEGNYGIFKKIYKEYNETSKE